MLVVAILWAAPSLADFENSNKDHTKHESNAGGNGNGNGRTNGNSASANGGTSASSSAQSSAIPDQNMALDAVSGGTALPLGQIIALAKGRWGGRAIDAKLLNVHSRLVYQLTMLSDQGVSRKVYYDAASGRAIKSP